MKKIYSFLIVVVLIIFAGKPANSQCTSAQLNWDYLDFLPSAVTNYTSWYPSGTFPYTQNFAMGTRRATLTMSPTSNFTLDGENNTNTGHASSFATDGDDVQFTTTTTSARNIAISLDSNVTNMQFSMFDLDNSQIVTITATNALGVSQLITVTKANAASGIIIVGSGTITPIATAPGAGYASNSNSGTINVAIAGPVKNINIALSAANGDIWLSDIGACVTGVFVNNWRNISRPFTGMPSYIITVVNKRIVMLDPATGVAKDIYTDPTSATNNINGLSYDPVNRKIYYAYSLTGSASTTKQIYQYDINTETKSTLISDITTAVNIPTYSVGLESGSASFYNGSLYYGVEGTHIVSGSIAYGGREHTIWRIDFDGTNTPYRSTQVYASNTDRSSPSPILIHDWSDIGVTNNGTLYDFDGARGDSMYYHFNMMTGQRTQYNPMGSGHHYPKQTAIDWTEAVYNMGDSLRTTPSKGFIVPYNYDGTVISAQLRTVTIGGSIVTGSWGDCGEAFRPYCDFGDAPDTFERYDLDPYGPAVHERDTAIRIGATFDREWSKTASVAANADGSDEDGLSYVPVLAPGYNMGTSVSVYNNTGSTATLVAWVDLNGNGQFESTEACNTVAAIASTPVQQTISIIWPAAKTATATITNGTYTYMRIRLVKSTSLPALSSSTPVGYYDNGEIEDYRTIVDNYPLAINLLSFDAVKAGTTTSKITWAATEDATETAYEIERSADARNWEKIAAQNSDNIAGTESYTMIDNQPLSGINYYRLVYTEAGGRKSFSAIRSVLFGNLSKEVTLLPNPASNQFNISINNTYANTLVHIKITSVSGNILYEQKKIANTGQNTYSISIPSTWPQGMYLVHINKDDETIVKKLLVNH
jgi:Secretion system C-terminal sorting domain/GEVED domain